MGVGNRGDSIGDSVGDRGGNNGDGELLARLNAILLNLLSVDFIEDARSSLTILKN